MKEPVVFILDDNEDICTTIRIILETVGIKARSFCKVEDFLQEIAKTLPNCLVLDVRIPEMSGLEIQDYLNQRQIHVPIIFVTGHGDVPMAVEAIKRGAVNFIEKPFRSQMLLDNVQKAIKEDQQRRSVDLRQQELQEKLNHLTSREREILDCLLSGKNNKIIAHDLSISAKTVDYHRANIFRKMQVDSLLELTRLIGPVQPPSPPARRFPVKYAV